MRQSAMSRSISLRQMASEYGSWPVAAAAHPMRMVREGRGAALSVGRMVERKCSNGTLVPKEQRFVGHHRLDHRCHQRFGVAAFEHGHQLAEGAEAGLARHR